MESQSLEEILLLQGIPFEDIRILEAQHITYDQLQEINDSDAEQLGISLLTRLYLRRLRASGPEVDQHFHVASDSATLLLDDQLADKEDLIIFATPTTPIQRCSQTLPLFLASFFHILVTISVLMGGVIGLNIERLDCSSGNSASQRIAACIFMFVSMSLSVFLLFLLANLRPPDQESSLTTIPIKVWIFVVVLVLQLLSVVAAAMLTLFTCNVISEVRYLVLVAAILSAIGFIPVVISIRKSFLPHNRLIFCECFRDHSPAEVLV